MTYLGVRGRNIPVYVFICILEFISIYTISLYIYSRGLHPAIVSSLQQLTSKTAALPQTLRLFSLRIVEGSGPQTGADSQLLDWLASLQGSPYRNHVFTTLDLTERYLVECTHQVSIATIK